jgi:hypothetical protein
MPERQMDWAMSCALAHVVRSNEPSLSLSRRCPLEENEKTWVELAVLRSLAEGLCKSSPDGETAIIVETYVMGIGIAADTSASRAAFSREGSIGRY